MTTIDAPRTPVRRTNWEKWGWMYMRASGVLLVVLIFTHLYVNMVGGEGVKQIDFAFVAGKWAHPFWQVWDLLLLWLALIHGGNGMRTIANDYTRPRTARILSISIWSVVAILIVLGTLVIFTFDPCPPSSPADLLPSFCSTL
ncbi:MAG TPA: succinate dehydrogenase hydrophobic membrane anchor subunit [Microbacteriaceae bacterium]|nr:succinate dehydrogenase hydrophobic membrane anchor subunit [Microbacteriaceae bacterium]